MSGGAAHGREDGPGDEAESGGVSGSGSESGSADDWSLLHWVRATDDPSPDAPCIEIADGPDDLVHIRQSDDPAHVVTTTRTKWRAFVLGVRNNEFDHFVQGHQDSPGSPGGP
ncbi:DUF397 domain-containing protein [Streptomyces sp. NPDC048172]|uniref:DUF397 domain-containing protein n=1 Tax=Streptomyces sp. NPDC048172 TaxID=3365505 RepID=UPI00371CE83A